MFVSLTIRKVWKNVIWHDCFGKAAQLAFYFQLALFPFLIFLLSVMSYIPDAKEIILFWLGRLMPPEAMNIVRKWVEEVFLARNSGWLSFSLIFALWSASYGVKALIDALNKAYDVEEGRPFWKSQLLALLLTVALCLLVVGGVVLITFGGSVIEWAGRLFGIERSFGSMLRYITGLVMLIVGTGMVYYFGPNARQKWHWIAPGAFFTAAAIVVVSYLFSFYLRYAPGYYAIYGNLAAVIVLMLWLYMLALIMYMGGEINSEIHKNAGNPVIPKETSRRGPSR